MAEAQILLGFGGCKFDDGVTVATFTGGSGIATYTPIQIIRENVDRDIVSRLLGYRVTLDCSELYNLISTDYLQYQNLATILSGLVNSAAQGKLTVTPRNDTGLDYNVEYECILTSAFSPKDIHRLKTGQVTGLQFTCINKVTNIPTLVSDTDTNNYWDGTDTYWDGTNTYIDDLG